MPYNAFYVPLAEGDKVNDIENLQAFLDHFDEETTEWTHAPIYIPKEKRDWLIKPNHCTNCVERHVAFVEYQANMKFHISVDAFCLSDRNMVLYIYIDDTLTCTHVIKSGKTDVVPRVVFTHNDDGSLLSFKEMITFPDLMASTVDCNTGTIRVGLVTLERMSKVSGGCRVRSQELEHKQIPLFSARVASLSPGASNEDLEDMADVKFECVQDECIGELCLFYRPQELIMPDSVVHYEEDASEMDNVDNCADSDEWTPSKGEERDSLEAGHEHARFLQSRNHCLAGSN
ncbi:hypothetical protein PQX77_009968, partial [Marasmius sp. AFHP31]